MACATAVAAHGAPADRLTAVVVHHVALHALRPLEATLGETELRSLTGERLDLAVQKRDAYEAIVVGVLGGRRRSAACSSRSTRS